MGMVDLKYNGHGYGDLREHIGHKIVCVGYGRKSVNQAPVNVAIECEDCNCVLVDFDKPTKIPKGATPKDCEKCPILGTDKCNLCPENHTNM